MKNSEDSLRDLWHTNWINSCITRDTWKRKDRKGEEGIFKERMPENLPNMEKKRNVQSQESQKVP